MRRLTLAVLWVAIATLACVPALAQMDTRAVITLGTDPMPPACAGNPGGAVTIFWTIQHATTAHHTLYRLYDSSHATIIEQEEYPGTSGDSVNRTWIVPVATAPGIYWVRVEYYSVGIGLEAAAETGFLVCEPTPPPPGVCCLGTTCVIVSQIECEMNDGLWRPDLTSCDPNPCLPPPPVAACCVGTSCQLVTEEECGSVGGLWHGDLPDCDPDPCLPPPPMSVCCVGSDCYVVTEEQCSSMDGLWLPDQGDCSGAPCAPSDNHELHWGAVKNLFR